MSFPPKCIVKSSKYTAKLNAFYNKQLHMYYLDSYIDI